MRVISNCDIYSDAQFLFGRLILDIDPPPHSCILFSICVHDPPLTHTYSRLQQPAVGLLPQLRLIGGRKACHCRNHSGITPFVLSLGAQPATTHGGCSRAAAARAGGTPGAAPALLLRRIPGEARPEGEGR